MNEAISLKDAYEERFIKLETKYKSEIKNEDEIMNEVDNKIQEWTEAVQQKEQLLQESESKVKSLETDLDQLRRVCDLDKMEDLENSLRARDERILELEEKLNDACEEINKFMSERGHDDDAESGQITQVSLHRSGHGLL